MAHLKSPSPREELVERLRPADSGFADSSCKNVLVVEDELVQLNAMVGVIGTGEIQSPRSPRPRRRSAQRRRRRFDCIVVDLGLPDMSGPSDRSASRPTPDRGGADHRLHRTRADARGRREPAPPLFHDHRQGRLARRTAPRRDSNFFLHRVEADLLARQAACCRRTNGNRSRRKRCDRRRRRAQHLRLTSILERHEMEVHDAENGRKGIELLEEPRHRHRVDGHHDARDGRL